MRMSDEIDFGKSSGWGTRNEVRRGNKIGTKRGGRKHSMVMTEMMWECWSVHIWFQGFAGSLPLITRLEGW